MCCIDGSCYRTIRQAVTPLGCARVSRCASSASDTRSNTRPRAIRGRLPALPRMPDSTLFPPDHVVDGWAPLAPLQAMADATGGERVSAGAQQRLPPSGPPGARAGEYGSAHRRSARGRSGSIRLSQYMYINMAVLLALRQDHENSDEGHDPALTYLLMRYAEQGGDDIARGAPKMPAPPETRAMQPVAILFQSLGSARSLAPADCRACRR